MSEMLCVLFDYDNEAAQAEFKRHKLSYPMLSQLEAMWTTHHFHGKAKLPLSLSIVDERSARALVRRGLLIDNDGRYRFSDDGIQAANCLFMYWYQNASGQSVSEPQHFTED